ncbi:MAG TPA: ferredoxin--NADP reductase [Polyangiaceae bacterium]|nr:ferredoxin--NADP reductase [Polyangiaceae bacterium]
MVWVESKLVERRVWAEGLISVRLDRVLSAFAPGQFVNLGLDLGEERVKRSYSLSSAPGEPSEFYLTLVAGGVLTPALFELPIGASLWIDDRPLGFFTLEHVPASRQLWMLATGTGLGPFLAMLRSPQVWERFARIVLVHGVRQVAHLGYAEQLAIWARERASQFSYVPVVSREAAPNGALAGRLPQLIASGELERAAGLALEPAETHVLLCGNPDMIRDVAEQLEARGMHKHRPRKPGHYSFENYW